MVESGRVASVIAGKYRLVRKLAAGGMGEVFLAMQRGPQGIEKRVVLKRVLPERDHESAAQMFLDEARVAADLHHPNVVDTYEVGIDDGVWFLAMEFLEGWDLRRIQTEAVLTKRPIPLGPALHVIADIARGLHYAHEKKGADGKPLRIVHRDVSPQNILVTRDGIAKLLDFGIAKADIPRAEVTDPGMIRGKVAYMSPEQAAGSAVDRRSDVFSLGIVLYEATTLTRVYTGDDLRQLYNRVADAKIATPSTVVPDYPKKLEEIVMKALRPRPSERFESADALATALEELLDDSGVPHSASKVARYLRSLFGDEDSMAKVVAPGDAATVATPAPASAAPAPVPGALASTEGDADPPDERAFLEAVHQVLDAGDRARVTNATEPEDAFVGRDRELADIEKRFEHGERLITLHGVGGVGKTRLALRASGRLARGSFAGGAWFVDASQAHTPDALCGAIGPVLGVPVTGADAVAQVGRALAARGRVLLVLDGFEALVAHADATVGRWLKSAPSLCVLATSREPLHLEEERVLPVEPLALPAEGAKPEDSPAVQLFLQRARRARPGFEPRPEDWPLIEKIVSLLDGLPLALELAAARLSVLTPEKMLELFPKRLELLRDTRSRRPALRTVLDESWDLLRPWERLAFAQASAFRGGFDLAAAEAVLDLSAERDAPWMLDVLQSLRDKSLLRSEEPRELPGEIRFSMYANVRDYAAEKLAESGSRDSTPARHTEYFLRAGAEWAAGVDTHGGAERLRRLAIERENLHAVLSRALETKATAAALRAVLAIDPVASARGPLGAHLADLDAALALPLEGAPPALLASTLLARGRVRRLRGLAADALGDLGRALTEARKAGDRGLVAEILVQTGATESFRGNVERARALEGEALEIATGAGDRRREALATSWLATLRYGTDAENQAKAGERYRRALAIHRELGDQRQEAVVLGNYGIFLRQQGRFEEALAVERDALRRYREQGERVWEGNKLGTLAGLHMDLERYDEARALYEQAFAVTRATGNRRSEGIFRGNAAILEHLWARHAAAREGYEAAVAILDETGDKLFGGMYRAYLAAVLADTDHPVPAERMLEEARSRVAPDPILVVAVELLALHLELARARRMNAGDARKARDAAAARLRDLRREEKQHEDVRLSSRLLERALARDSS